MKKTILTLMTLMFALTLFGQAGQNAKERRAAEFAAEAQKTFKINDAAAAEIAKLWIARQDAFQEVGKKAKAGSVSVDEQKAMNLQVSTEYRDKMIAILGCKPNEFRKFNQKFQTGN